MTGHDFRRIVAAAILSPKARIESSFDPASAQALELLGCYTDLALECGNASPQTLKNKLCRKLCNLLVFRRCFGIVAADT